MATENGRGADAGVRVISTCAWGKKERTGSVSSGKDDSFGAGGSPPKALNAIISSDAEELFEPLRWMEALRIGALSATVETMSGHTCLPRARMPGLGLPPPSAKCGEMPFCRR